MMASADVVGYAATVVGTSMMLPKLVRSWRTQHMHDVAWGMITLFLFNCLLWLAYGLMIDSLPIVAANVFTLGVNAINLWQMWAYRRPPSASP